MPQRDYGTQIDVGYSDQRRVPSSARRFTDRATRPVTREMGATRPTTPDDIIRNIEEFETVEPAHVINHRASAQKKRIAQPMTTTTTPGYIPQRRPLPDTDEIPVRARRQYSRRQAVCFLIGGALGTLSLGAILGSWVKSSLDQLMHQLEEGRIAAKPIQVVCGHHDNADHPTVIEAYLVVGKRDLTITVVEQPGGNNTYAHISQTAGLRSYYGYRGDPTQVYIQLTGDQLPDGKYQIRMHVECGGVGVYADKKQIDFLMIDSGKGYFLPVQPKN